MSEERYSRQSFLGPDAENIIANAVIGVMGLGGGGSHIIQQSAHIGFRKYVIYDPQPIELSNINRLVGATVEDVAVGLAKVEIAKRLILGLQPDAEIQAFQSCWQEDPLPLRSCDLIFGCLDGFLERRDLELSARRYLIPYIDIGLGVHQVGTEPPVMAGQVILSLPGGPCMTCLNFLNEKNLAAEGTRYGDAGPRPQVVWANGVLASTAVGVAVDLLTGWSGNRNHVYLAYYGNSGEIKSHQRLNFVSPACEHFPIIHVGDPVSKRL